MEGLIHERREVVPPHGDLIRLDIRRPDRDPPRTAILIAHGFKGFKDWGFFPYLGERLAHEGHLVISFNASLGGIGPDLMTFSDLDAFRRNTFSREVDDIGWLLGELGRGTLAGGPAPRRLGLLGHSRGAGAAVVAASERSKLGALVTWAAISTFDRWTENQIDDWATKGVTYSRNARTGQDMPLGRRLWDDYVENRGRLDILAAARRVAAPWLIVHGTDDEAVPVAEASQLGEASGARLEIISNTGHTFGAKHPMAAPPAPLDRAIDATIAHFRQSLAQAAPQ